MDARNYPQAESAKTVCISGQTDRTVSENIDAKIESLKAEIERLEKSKETLAPLMNMRIRDIREAMNY